MSNNSKKLLIFLLIFCVALGYFFLNNIKTGSVENYVVLKEEKFVVEIASTSEQLSRGLGYRDNLCNNCAMLFLFGESDYHGFWMKGMRFPIDIIWIEDSKIVHIEKNVRHDSETIYKPQVKSDSVLEVNAGISERFGLKIGDSAGFHLNK